MRMRVLFSMMFLAVLCSAGNLFAAGHWEVQIQPGVYVGTPTNFACIGPTDTCFVRYTWVPAPVDTTTPINPGTTAIYIPKEERGYVNARVSMMLEKDGSLRVTVSGDKLIEVYSREELVKYLEALRASEGKQ